MISLDRWVKISSGDIERLLELQRQLFGSKGEMPRKGHVLTRKFSACMVSRSLLLHRDCVPMVARRGVLSPSYPQTSFFPTQLVLTGSDQKSACTFLMSQVIYQERVPSSWTAGLIRARNILNMGASEM